LKYHFFSAIFRLGSWAIPFNNIFICEQVEPQEFTIKMAGGQPNLAQLGPLQIINRGPDDAFQLAIIAVGDGADSIHLTAVGGCSLQAVAAGRQRAACPLLGTGAEATPLTTSVSFSVLETAQGRVEWSLRVESSCQQTLSIPVTVLIMPSLVLTVSPVSLLSLSGAS
jgi:hypothetical protein